MLTFVDMADPVGRKVMRLVPEGTELEAMGEGELVTLCQETTHG